MTTSTDILPSKVARVTLWFWIMKICATTVGEAGGDMFSMTLNWGYLASSLMLLALFLVALVAQLRARRFHPFLYWAVILATNTLGTALGDFLADSSGLGYGMSNLLISAAIALVAAACFFTRASRTVLFWLAFVLTRPFGATMGDLLTKTPARGGLGFGTIGSSAVLLALLVATILWSGRADRAARRLSRPA